MLLSTQMFKILAFHLAFSSTLYFNSHTFLKQILYFPPPDTFQNHIIPFWQAVTPNMLSVSCGQDTEWEWCYNRAKAHFQFIFLAIVFLKNI